MRGKTPLQDIAGEHPDVVMVDYIQNTFGLQPLPLDPSRAAKNNDGMNFLQKEAETPIYEGSNVNRLARVMELLKIQARNATMTNQCVDDVLSFINNFIIDPKLGNRMPRTRYEVRKIVSDGGLDYVSIHACPCDGMLYYGAYDKLTKCPIEGCSLPRYKDGMLTTKVPRKVCVLLHAFEKVCFFNFPPLSEIKWFLLFGVLAMDSGIHSCYPCVQTYGFCAATGHVLFSTY
jgi:hypothetical protein